MKKSFGGQMVLSICLIFLALILLSSATQYLYYRATLDYMQEELTDTAAAAADMAGFLSGETTQSRQLLCVQLNYTSRATGSDTVVCDESGSVVACSCGLQTCEHLGYQFPKEFLDRSSAAAPHFDAGLNFGCYEGKRIAAVVPISASAGSLRYVVASRPAEQITQQMSSNLKANILVVLLVLLGAIPVIWSIVQRQIRPIKEMTDAARKISHGRMDVQINTGHTDTTEFSELAVAFNNMAQALSKSELKRQEFVANVSHELKTPMTTISGYMDGMLDGTIPPEQHKKYMEIVSNEVKRLSRLVRSMLEISRLKDQHVPAERKRVFDLCQTVGEVLLSFEQKINDKHLEVETDLPDTGARAFADPDSVTQVVYNLIDNAVKFCPEGGTLGLKVSQTNKNKYLVSIRNTGPTIPPEELPLVFDRFHKTDKSRSEDPTGVGLGLYIVKTIILSHEEDVYVSSRDGVTEFSFTMSKAPGI